MVSCGDRKGEKKATSAQGANSAGTELSRSVVGSLQRQMIEVLVGGGPMFGPHRTSYAERTAFISIGRECAGPLRCRLHHLVRARQSLLHRGSQAWAGRVGLSLPSVH